MSQCNGKHDTSICQSREEEESKKSESKEAQTDVLTSMFVNAATSVVMQTARANISSVGSSVQSFNVRVLFDNGSQRTFVSKRLQNALKLRNIGTRNLKIARFMDEVETRLQENHSTTNQGFSLNRIILFKNISRKI